MSETCPKCNKPTHDGDCQMRDPITQMIMWRFARLSLRDQALVLMVITRLSERKDYPNAES